MGSFTHFYMVQLLGYAVLRKNFTKKRRGLQSQKALNHQNQVTRETLKSQDQSHRLEV